MMRLSGIRQQNPIAIAVCFLLLLSFPILAESEEPDTTALTVAKTESDFDKAAILDLRVVYEDDSISGLVAPPAGVYPFEPGDGVVLRAYGRGAVPVAISWSGDVSGTGETLYVDMDVSKRITVTFSRVAQWPEKEEPPWFTVSENKNFYAFLGGGDLYGWFAASRNEKKGAGITHITHHDSYLIPLMHNTSLNFEHIFSGAAADNYRSTFTPRTDPMKFCIEAPGTARVQWPPAGSFRNMESEKIYHFDGNDAKDVAFSTIPQDDAFPLDYIGFMWATYQNRFFEPAIYFQGVSEGVENWIRFGPEMSENRLGRTVSFLDSESLQVETGADEFNAFTLEDVHFTKPVFYGLLDLSLPESSQKNKMALVMMFDQEQPIRFAVWNWCNPTAISAWDWQYIVHNPRPGQQIGYRARMVCTESDVPDGVMSRYQAWRELPAVSPEADILLTYPHLPIYWSPAIHEFEPLEMGRCLEGTNPNRALDLYRELLSTIHYSSRAARQMANLLLREYDAERRNKECIDTCNYWSNQVLPLSNFGKACYDVGDFEATNIILKKALEIDPDNVNSRFYLGAARLWLNNEDEGIGLIEEAVTREPVRQEKAATIFATRAATVMEAGNFALAETLYRKAIALAPDDHWHEVHLGEMLDKQGREDEALALYQIVLLASPESPYTAQLVDNLYRNRNDIEGCIQFWHSIYEQHNKAVVPALHLGMAYYDNSEHESAEAVLQATLEGAPENAEISFYLGASRLRLDKVDEGIALIEVAVAREPMLAEQAVTVFATHAANVLAAGDYVLAETLYRKAVALVREDIGYPVYPGETFENQSKEGETLE